MSETPSKRRRKGRAAFCPGIDPMDLQPYNPESWYYSYHLEDWLKGWHEAELEYERRQSEPATLEDRIMDLEVRVVEMEELFNELRPAIGHLTLVLKKLIGGDES